MEEEFFPFTIYFFLALSYCLDISSFSFVLQIRFPFFYMLFFSPIYIIGIYPCIDKKTSTLIVRNFRQAGNSHMDNGRIGSVWRHCIISINHDARTSRFRTNE